MGDADWQYVAGVAREEEAVAVLTAARLEPLLYESLGDAVVARESASHEVAVA